MELMTLNEMGTAIVFLLQMAAVAGVTVGAVLVAVGLAVTLFKIIVKIPEYLEDRLSRE